MFTYFCAAAPARVVLDTQTVLDWCGFDDPVCADWTLPAPQQWQWLVCPQMRDELRHVVERGFGARWPIDAARVMAFMDRHATPTPSPALPAPVQALVRCTDRDDQPFIDLAVVSAPSLLVSRDRAVLKVARRAASRGVQIISPPQFPFRRMLAPAGSATDSAPTCG